MKFKMKKKKLSEFEQFQLGGNVFSMDTLFIVIAIYLLFDGTGKKIKFLFNFPKIKFRFKIDNLYVQFSIKQEDLNTHND